MVIEMDPKEYEEDYAGYRSTKEEDEAKKAMDGSVRETIYNSDAELNTEWGNGDEYLNVEQRFQMNIVAQREERQIRAQAIQLAIQASVSGLVTDITYLDAAEGILAFLVEGDDTSD